VVAHAVHARREPERDRPDAALGGLEREVLAAAAQRVGAVVR
jgi:hypothetical protein